MNCKSRTAACLALFWLAIACRPESAADPLALYPASPEGDAALLPATLTRKNGCLYLVSETGERWLAAFPSPGTHWDAARESIRVGGEVVRLGETSRFGGGELRAGPRAIKWVKAPRPECDGSLIWIVTVLVEP